MFWRLSGASDVRFLRPFTYNTNENIERLQIIESKKLSVNIVDEAWLKEADRMGVISGNKEDKSESGKIDYHTFKPVLFEFPTYEYFVTGEKVGDCAKMN